MAGRGAEKEALGLERDGDEEGKLAVAGGDWRKDLVLSLFVGRRRSEDGPTRRRNS